MTIERRYLSEPITTSEKNRVVGYVSVFNQPTTMQDTRGRRFAEVVRPGAFTRSLQRHQEGGPDVLALFNHDRQRVLGRTKSGTLQLVQDPRGLQFSLDLPRTALGEEVRTMLERGDIAGC